MDNYSDNSEGDANLGGLATIAPWMHERDNVTKATAGTPATQS